MGAGKWAHTLDGSGGGSGKPLANGFTIEMLDALVRDGLATVERRAMLAGRKPVEVIWLTITGGRRSRDDGVLPSPVQIRCL
jgi:hypothetical protein